MRKRGSRIRGPGGATWDQILETKAPLSDKTDERRPAGAFRCPPPSGGIDGSRHRIAPDFRRHRRVGRGAPPPAQPDPPATSPPLQLDSSHPPPTPRPPPA